MSTESAIDWDSLPEKTIPQFFAGLDVFITGGTGFLGKALIEKLLRSCPDIGNIYVLVRPRRGKSSQVRLEQTFNDILFDTLREQGPQVFGKVVAVAGDVAEPGLGLSPADRQLLQERVSVVFNAAASVRFTDPLQKAVFTNVRSTRDSLQLATGMKQLKVFLHVSTAYSNADRFEVEEKLYPPPGDWRTYLKAAETLDDFNFQAITKKLIGYHPNTYTFTKSLAEQVVNDHRDKLPVVIIRPSVVVMALNEPLHGWADNMNGPFGLNFAVSKGIIHVLLLDRDIFPDFIYVDVVTKGIIIAAWRRAHESSASPLRVYNAAAGEHIKCSLNDIVTIGDTVLKEVPLKSIYYPFSATTKSYIVFILSTFLLHLSLSSLLDGLLYLSRKKPRLLKLQRIIYLAMIELHIFMFERWTFSNKNFFELENHLHPSDETTFQYNIDGRDTHKEMAACASVVRLTIMGETSTLEENCAHQKKLLVVHCVLCALGMTLLWWLCNTYALHWTLMSVPVRIARAVFMV